MIMADDEEREYGDAAGAEAKKTEYEALGLEIISMRDDFGTIYGEKWKKSSLPPVFRGQKALFKA